MRNFKFLGAMLVFLVSLESCKGCAVGAGAGAGADAGCPAGQEQINGACTGATPYTCPTGQINIDDGTTATSCKAVVVVANRTELVAEIVSAVGGTNWTANLNYIDISKVTSLSNLFAIFGKINNSSSSTSYTTFGLQKFNGRIDKWNTSSVTDMSYMFFGDTVFNQPIGNWDVSKVTDMGAMFYGAAAFNQDISKWDVSNVTDMSFMFIGATKFKQDLSNWKPLYVPSALLIGLIFNGSHMTDADIKAWAPWCNDGGGNFCTNAAPSP